MGMGVDGTEGHPRAVSPSFVHELRERNAGARPRGVRIDSPSWRHNVLVSMDIVVAAALFVSFSNLPNIRGALVVALVR